jgi:signal transduction histidine kinase/ActR/RegA family two-component response regulator
MSSSLTQWSNEEAISATDTVSQRLRAEQIALLCKHSKPAIIGGAFAAWYICWLLLSEHSVANVAIWYGLLLIVSVGRIFIQRRFLAARADGIPADLHRHSAYVLIGIAINGIVWSLPSTWLLLTDPSKQVMSTVFLVGLSAAGLSSLAPMRLAYTAFIAPFMLPIAIDYFIVGGDYTNVGLGVALFVVSMMAAARRNTGTIEDSLRLQLANAELAAREQREKAVVERANRDLEQQIAQRERTEAELRIAKSEAEAANRAKNQFLANMSHELRTPLNGVLGTSDLLIRALPNSPQLAKSHKYAQTIRNAGERLLHLINDILDMARIEAGAIRFDNASFDPRRLIADAVESATEQCAEKNLTLHAAIAPEVPHELRGDVYRLRQVLSNLLSNAIKFTERGGIEIRVAVKETIDVGTTQRVLLRWSIADSGIGIAQQSRTQLFQPFSQLDDSSTRRFGGTGLGLAICRQIINALGGRIDVESTPGSGSTFWFEVPLDLPDHSASVRASAALKASQSLGGNILVVEDNETNCHLIVEMLELAGCKTHTATNGIEALEKLSFAHFDTVLMDWHMPRMDGLAATRNWRQREAANSDASRLPIIALTASVLPGDRDACLQAGMDDFIAKPFTYDELVNVVARWLPAPGAAPVTRDT